MLSECTSDKLFRRLDARGSMSLMGIWLMGFLLLVSAIMFVYSRQEIRVSDLERESYNRQLLAESIMEKQLLLMQEDFSQVEKILAFKDYYAPMISQGEQGKYIYEIRAMHDAAGKIYIGVTVKNKDDPTAENIFSIRWHLEVDKDEQTVEQSGIG